MQTHMKTTVIIISGSKLRDLLWGLANLNSGQ